MVWYLQSLHTPNDAPIALPREGSVSIGRHAQSQILCKDMAVSGRHCTLHCRTSGLQPSVDEPPEVEDSSTHGSYVNELRISKGQRQQMSAGDVLSLTKPPEEIAATVDVPPRVQYRLDFREQSEAEVPEIPEKITSEDDLNGENGEEEESDPMEVDVRPVDSKAGEEPSPPIRSPPRKNRRKDVPPPRSLTEVFDDTVDNIAVDGVEAVDELSAVRSEIADVKARIKELEPKETGTSAAKVEEKEEETGTSAAKVEKKEEEEVSDTLPDDAPEGHRAFVDVKWQPAKRQYAYYFHVGKKKFEVQVSANSVAGDEEAAGVIARACYVKTLDELWEKDAVEGFKREYINKIRASRGVAVLSVKARPDLLRRTDHEATSKRDIRRASHLSQGAMEDSNRTPSEILQDIYQDLISDIVIPDAGVELEESPAEHFGEPSSEVTKLKLQVRWACKGGDDTLNDLLENGMDHEDALEDMLELGGEASLKNGDAPRAKVAKVEGRPKRAAPEGDQAMHKKAKTSHGSETKAVMKKAADAAKNQLKVKKTTKETEQARERREEAERTKRVISSANSLAEKAGAEVDKSGKVIARMKQVSSGAKDLGKQESELAKSEAANKAAVDSLVSSLAGDDDSDSESNSDDDSNQATNTKAALTAKVKAVSSKTSSAGGEDTANSEGDEDTSNADSSSNADEAGSATEESEQGADNNKGEENSESNDSSATNTEDQAAPVEVSQSPRQQLLRWSSKHYATMPSRRVFLWRQEDTRCWFCFADFP